MMPSPMMAPGGYQQQQPAPGYGQQQPVPGYGYQQGPPQWDASQGHPSTVGHDDFPSPGGLHFTPKQYWTRVGIWFIGGIALGGFIMFRLFPIFVRVIQATSGI